MTIIRSSQRRILSLHTLQQCHRRLMANYKDLFTDSKQTQCYANFRPSYTDDVFKRIVEFCKKGSCEFDLAVDVGCGSGQSTVPLAHYFEKVLGFDVSEAQIANAPRNNPKVRFSVSPAESLSSVQPASADLVTIAQAFHWVDKDKFFAEVDRILKPGGSLVVYGYGNGEVEPPEANTVFLYLYEDVLGKYWSRGRHMVEDKYGSVTLPYSGWVRDDSLAIVKDCTVAEFIGYLNSWSALAQYYKVHPHSRIMEDVENKFLNICHGEKVPEAEDKPCLKITWPVFMLMGHKPK